MNQLNSLILEGHLVRDSVPSEPAPGFKKCSFTVGVNRYYKNKNNQDVNEVSFFDVEAYGTMAEYCAEKAKKGRGVRVVGRLKQDTWKTNDGKSASRVYVVAEHIEYKPLKKDSSENPAEQKPETKVESQPTESQQVEAQPVAVEEATVF